MPVEALRSGGGCHLVRAGGGWAGGKGEEENSFNKVGSRGCRKQQAVRCATVTSNWDHHIEQPQKGKGNSDWKHLMTRPEILFFLKKAGDLQLLLFIALSNTMCNLYSSFLKITFAIHKSAFNIGSVAPEGWDLTLAAYWLNARRMPKVNEGLDN